MRTGEGWLYLAMLPDLFSRKVVSPETASTTPSREASSTR